MAICVFNDCGQPALDGSDKCHFHRNRTKCSVPECTNQVYARHLCIRHGGKRTCQYPDCVTNARAGDLCAKHGGAKHKPLCSIEGCAKKAYGRNRCIAHGGGKQCLAPQCRTRARVSGYCWRHRHKTSAPTDDPLLSIVDAWMNEDTQHEDASGPTPYYPAPSPRNS
ncbi:hypothetical protein SDRG_06098 [Saprolegnia diclina VS20]|uniref:WRKY19-like zinc finger domain-containing protein n=1 Tax=Saprolegnia diclina (strain VS20) TaxID=1156394 RepID=T0S1S9_SAPDV|nr:hypothetical protein SDRG_06098 [Saprolegnia diclina VS20]EQC36662.1 hypothetical protein SDRG_06098 [Saprolegnia diclina VS20]|eukprot:XP_008610083.1 hypothetical protein SDRG_06098 [Saprolegnia diclina VS20]